MKVICTDEKKYKEVFKKYNVVKDGENFFINDNIIEFEKEVIENGDGIIVYGDVMEIIIEI